MKPRLNNRRWCVAALAFAVWTVITPPAWGQTPFGAIEGVVRDQSGAVLPGVTVEVSSAALLEGTRLTVTGSTGQYRFLRLPVGEYAMKFSVTGFRTVERTGVVLNADFTATINVELGVGTLVHASRA